MKNETALTDKIRLMEVEMNKLPQADCPVRHMFAPGTYIREVTLPVGATAIGHHQRFEHINVFLKGKVTILNDDGSTTTLTAPLFFIGGPGRKCGYVHEEVVWLNIYPTDETDVETLENTYLDKSLSISPKLLSLNEHIVADQTDYMHVLTEFGFTEGTVRAQSENEADQIPFPQGVYKVAVLNSVREGKGLFATGNIPAGEVIAPTRLNGMRTPAGRYINHSKTPNAKMVAFGNDIYVVALKDIQGCKGGTPGDEIVTNYRDNLLLIGGIPCQA